jgi:hypothetical protein
MTWNGLTNSRQLRGDGMRLYVKAPEKIKRKQTKKELLQKRIQED